MNTDYITADKMREIKPSSGVMEYIMTEIQQCISTNIQEPSQELKFTFKLIGTFPSGGVSDGGKMWGYYPTFYNSESPVKGMTYPINTPIKVVETLLKHGYTVTTDSNLEGEWENTTITVSWKEPEYIKLYESAY